MSDLITNVAPGIKMLDQTVAWPGFINPYLIEGDKKAIIDIGPTKTVPGVLSTLAKTGVKPEEIDYLVLTHIHLDHGGGSGLALKSLPNAKVVLHPKGIKHLAEPEALWKSSIEVLGDLAREYGELTPIPMDRMIPAQDHMKLDMGKGLVLELLFTPGHASHHLCVYEHKNKVIFAGDAAGVPTSGVLRVTSPPPFRLEEYIGSIDMLIKLQPKILCFAHRGFTKNAVVMLEASKQKTYLWYKIAQAGAKAGKTLQQVIDEILNTDPDMAYMKTASKEEFERDYHLITSSVNGLMLAK